MKKIKVYVLLAIMVLSLFNFIVPTNVKAAVLKNLRIESYNSCTSNTEACAMLYYQYDPEKLKGTNGSKDMAPENWEMYLWGTKPDSKTIKPTVVDTTNNILVFEITKTIADSVGTTNNQVNFVLKYHSIGTEYGDDAWYIRDVIQDRKLTLPPNSNGIFRYLAQDNMEEIRYVNDTGDMFSKIEERKPMQYATFVKENGKTYIEFTLQNDIDTQKMDSYLNSSTTLGELKVTEYTTPDISTPGEDGSRVNSSKNEVTITKENLKKYTGGGENRVYRLEIQGVAITNESMKKKYTISIYTGKTTFFSGTEYTNPVLDYAGGVTFDNLIRTDFSKDDAAALVGGLGVTKKVGTSEYDVKIFAPFATNVFLEMEGKSPIKMSSDTNGVFSTKVSGVMVTDKGVGPTYTFTAVNYGFVRKGIVDPYAKTTSANGSKAFFVDEDIFFKKVRSDADKVTHSNTKMKDAQIYETHVTDLTNASTTTVNRGKFNGVDNTILQRIKDLGVNYIHFLPLQENGRIADQGTKDRYYYTWGYGPQSFMAVEGMYAYSSESDRKATGVSGNDESKLFAFEKSQQMYNMINRAHGKGLGIILDVCFNHTYNVYSSSFEKIAPHYYHRTIVKGPHKGELAKSEPSANEIRSELPITRLLIKDTIKNWVTKYGVDGFRFDLMGVLDNTTMNEVRAVVKSGNPENAEPVIYGEGWKGYTAMAENKTQYEEHTYPNVTAHKENQNTFNSPNDSSIGVFNDDFRNALVGKPKIDSNLGDQSGLLNNQNTYMEAHMRNLPYGISGGAYNLYGTTTISPYRTTQLINFVDLHDDRTLKDQLNLYSNLKNPLNNRYATAETYFLTSQGVPLIQGGAEYMRSKGGSLKSEDIAKTESISGEVTQINQTANRENMYIFKNNADLNQTMNQYLTGLLKFRNENSMFRIGNTYQTRLALDMYEPTIESNNYTTFGYALNSLDASNDPFAYVAVLTNFTGSSRKIPLHVENKSGTVSTNFKVLADTSTQKFASKMSSGLYSTLSSNAVSCATSQACEVTVPAYATYIVGIEKVNKANVFIRPSLMAYIKTNTGASLVGNYTITLKKNGVTISSQKITKDGLVRFSNLKAESGYTLEVRDASGTVKELQDKSSFTILSNHNEEVLEKQWNLK